MANKPDYPTKVAARLGGGRFLGTDNSVWLYRRVPLSPVADAKTTEKAIQAGYPLHAAYEEVASLTIARGNRRSMVRSAYRQTHALLVNIPRAFEPAPGPLQNRLRELYSDQWVDSRVLLFGVRLNSSVGNGGFRSAWDSIVESWTEGGTPLSDYDKDYAEVSRAFDNAGLKELSNEDYRLANAWWNYGTFPDTPACFHNDHMHVFTTPESATIAQQFGADDCAAWPDLPDAHAITFTSVNEFELPYVEAGQTVAKWMLPFVDSGAIVTSIRARVEPARVTREELRRQRKGYMDDLQERYNQQKMDRAEHDAKVQELADVEGIYAEGNGPATLVDTSVIIGFNGVREEAAQISTSEVKLNVMSYRQQQAWGETMICSDVPANPNLHDLPAPAIAYSGLPALNTVGDREGAVAGFTERDRQPALLSPVAVAQEDTYPICVVAAASGSGKSMMMLWLADQYSRMGRPVVIIDPKEGSDHSEAVRLSGGQVASLDELTSADGALDALRFAPTPDEGIDMAAAMILEVNPFGNDMANYEVPLIAALRFGVSRGATCTGQALWLAAQEQPNDAVTAAMVQKIFAAANAMPMFRALVGFNPTTEGLRIANGITYIRVGSAHLNLPDQRNTAPSLPERVSLAVVRMMLFGAATALTGRDGVIMQDEAWTILNARPSEVVRLGRLARSQRVLPILFSQDISGAVRAGLRGFISRGFVGPIADPDEARNALDLFGIEATPERLARITAPATTDSYGQDEFAAPNPNSMKALKDPRTGEVIRGSVWLYSDLAGRVVPIECVIPKSFLEVASTNAVDMDARQARAEAEAAAALGLSTAA